MDHDATAPILLTLADVMRISGDSRSQIYRDLAAGKFMACKSGRSLRIDAASHRAYLASLPPATFRAPRLAA
jgi:predicted DNA-binding transcriptional regulator AlpA